jgi:acetyl-CoA synthetase
MRAAEGIHPPPAASRLRVASSVGGALPAAAVEWARQSLGIELHNQYGQAELGLAVINHHVPALQNPALPGSIGRAMPGLQVVVVDDSGQQVSAGIEGELAIDTEKSPLFWFKGYHRDPAGTAQRFRHGPRFYLTGDLARIDADGNVHYLGLINDAIKSAGYLIGPVEIERILVSHPAVADAMVVGRPDKLLGEVAKAFLVLKPGEDPFPNLARDIAEYVTARVTGYSYPPEIEFVATLPRQHGEQ